MGASAGTGAGSGARAGADYGSGTALAFTDERKVGWLRFACAEICIDNFSGRNR